MALQPANICGCRRTSFPLLRLITTLLPLLAAVDSAFAATYYVDGAGLGGVPSDTNPGTITQPFKTITKARDTIRALGTGGHTVYLRGGTYYLTQSLQFGATDSGAAGAPNRYVAYPGEAPVLRGSIRIPTSAFTIYSGSIIQANAGSYGITRAAQAFFNGERLLKARYPNYRTPDFGATDPFAGSFLYVASDTPSSTTQFTYASGSVDPSRWTNVPEIQVDIFFGPNYENNIKNVVSIDPSTRLVTLASAISTYSGVTPNNRYYFANVFEELDAPNEYYFKTATSTLYLYPPHTLAATDEISIPVVTDLISCNGASYLDLQGLTVGECDGKGLYIYGGHHITIDHCTVTDTGAEGIRLWETSNSTVTNCTVTETGTDGLTADGSSADLKALTPSNHLISHNMVHDIGAIKKGSTGIRLNKTVGATVSWNYLYDLPRIAILFNGNDNVIAYNRLENVNRETQDTGVIYQFGRSWVSRGNSVHHNYIQGVGGYGYSGGAWHTGLGTVGIYLDDFASGTHAYGNTIEGVISAAYFVHSGRDNHAENNTIVGPAAGPLVLFNAWANTNAALDVMWTELQDCKNNLNGWNGTEYYRRYPELNTITQAHPAQQDLMSYNSFTDNTVIYPRSVQPLYYCGYLDRNTSTIDRNVFWPGTNPITLTGRDGYTWSSWLAAGFDNNSRNIVTTLGAAPQDYLLLMNTEMAAKTYDLGSQIYRDVNGTLISGSVTLQPFESRVLFIPSGYSLIVTAANGSVTATPNKISYAYGDVVTLQAASNTGYSFSGWSGDASGTANPTTITMDTNKSVTANFTATPVTYILTISAVNGSVTVTPSKTSYLAGDVITLQATPNAGYSFSGWSGDASGTANPTTITMNANKSVTAGFTANTYTLTITAVNGSITATPSKTSYAYGDVVTLQATPNAGYTFSGWSGDASGTTNPTTITMNANKSVTAAFTANTYILTTSAVNGSVTKTPSKTSYIYGDAVSLQAVANTGYKFAGWSGDASGTADPTTITMNADKSVAASFVAADQAPPVVDNCSPAPDAIQAPPNTLVSLHLRDDGAGVDAASVSLHVNGALVYAGDVNSYAGPLGVCSRTGTKADYTYTYEQNTPYGNSRKVSVTVDARDLAGNTMPEQTYAFATEMHAFGINRSVSADQMSLNQGKSATVSDGQGNLRIVWQAGNAGSRQIYAARYVPDADTYNASVRISRSTGDHCNPAVAVDGAGTLYVVWQENASGVWDIYASTSVAGGPWSTPKRVTDAVTNSPTNRVNPAVAASRLSPGLVAVAWQDDRAGNQDIYVAKSTNQFQTLTTFRVTSDAALQTNPALALDSQDAIVVLWTDARNGATDIYGATSDNGPWTNVPVVNAAGNQFSPKVAAGASGRVLHLAWVDEAAGNPDIFYARAAGLAAGPVAGVSIVDDTSGAAQRAPALTATAGADGNDRVFVCWEDDRNLAYAGTTDLYFAEVSPGALRTNILVDNDGTSRNQREVTLGLDRCGYPYVVWTDDRGKTLQLYYAGATYADPVPLAKATISAAAGGTVGTAPSQIKTLDDVSVVIPAQACPFDVTISIARIANPQGYSTQSLRQYDFGPSGLVFAQPVTITIPYNGSVSKKAKALWFDSVTGAFSSAGVTNVQDLALGSGLRALQFQTTHFTPFYVVPADAATDAGGGGGCSLSRSGASDPVGYCVPFLGLAAIMTVLRVVDRRRASAALQCSPESLK